VAYYPICLFNDCFSISDYTPTASSGRMINECRIGKNGKGSGRGLIKVLQRYFARGAEENRAERQDSRSPGRDVNPGLDEYEAGVLNTGP
jgi:hypothetical protein